MGNRTTNKTCTPTYKKVDFGREFTRVYFE